MQARYIQQAIDTLERSAPGASEGVVPCTQEEVEALQALVPAPHRLPEAYREFLLYGGKKLAGVFRVVDFSYDMAKTELEHGFRDVLSMLRAWDPDAELPASVLVLNEHLGSNFTYIDLAAGDDPPVYLWEEGEGGLDTAIKEHDTFSDFLVAQVQKYLSRRSA